VQVLGAVDHPGDVTVHEGDRLSMAIARAGNGTNSNSDLNHITLRRVQAGGVTKTMNINLYDVLKSGDVSRDPVMEKNDLVYVPQSAGHTDRVSGPASLLYSLSHLFIP
jgi:polysaccharide export outer membrane protein